MSGSNEAALRCAGGKPDRGEAASAEHDTGIEEPQSDLASSDKCDNSTSPPDDAKSNLTPTGATVGAGALPGTACAPTDPAYDLALITGEGALARALAGSAEPYPELTETVEEREAFEEEFRRALVEMEMGRGPGACAEGSGRLPAAPSESKELRWEWEHVEAEDEDEEES